MAEVNVDLTNTESYDPIPAGRYEVMVTEAEVKPKNDGTGTYVNVTFVVINNGEYDGRKVWYMASNKGTPGANRQHEVLLQALGVPFEKGVVSYDTDDLINKTCVCDVELEPRHDGDGMRNKIKRLIAA